MTTFVAYPRKYLWLVAEGRCEIAKKKSGEDCERWSEMSRKHVRLAQACPPGTLGPVREAQTQQILPNDQDDFQISSYVGVAST